MQTINQAKESLSEVFLGAFNCTFIRDLIGDSVESNVSIFVEEYTRAFIHFAVLASIRISVEGAVRGLVNENNK